MEQLTICGVGLISGSLALAARERGLARRIVGVDVLASALPAGLVDEAVPAHAADACREAIASADLTVLAMPVRAIEQALPRVLDAVGPQGIVTDCGSTKRVLIEAARNHAAAARFVAGHPMAGHPEGGVANARADLFEGRKWLLCPESLAAPDALERVTDFVRALGAEVIVLGAAEHDHSVALTSHVPQVVASALAVLVSETGAGAAAGPGFASATRVAGGAEAMWRDIFVSNGDAIAAALRKLADRLAPATDALGKIPPDPEQALTLLAQARALREQKR